MEHNVKPVPQMRVKTNLTAGESVEACQRNLDQWRKQLERYCQKNAGARPYRETEMQWWQAGSV